jgi:hypothetical protein
MYGNMVHIMDENTPESMRMIMTKTKQTLIFSEGVFESTIKDETNPYHFQSGYRQIMTDYLNIAKLLEDEQIKKELMAYSRGKQPKNYGNYS